MIILFSGNQHGRPCSAGEKDEAHLGSRGSLRRQKQATRGLPRFTNTMKPLLWKGTHSKKGKSNHQTSSPWKACLYMYKAFPPELVLGHTAYSGVQFIFVQCMAMTVTNERRMIWRGRAWYCKKVKTDSLAAGGKREGIDQRCLKVVTLT